MAEKKSADTLVNLRKAVAQMDLILANLKEGVLVVGGDLQVVFINDAYGDIMQVDRILLLGKSLKETLPLLKDGEPVFSDAKEARIEIEKIQSLSGTYTMKTGSGAMTVVDVTAAYIPKIDEAVFVVRDVTESEKANQELKKLNNFMMGREVKMADMKKELQDLKQRISELEAKQAV